MYINHCLFSDMINKYKSLLFSNIDEWVFSMPSTPNIWLNESTFYILCYRVLCSLCLSDVFRFNLTLES